MSLIEVTEPHIIYALFGSFVCLFGFLSLFIKEKLYISESVFSTLFGIIIGPACIGIFDPLSWSSSDIITLELTRVIIAIQVFAIGVELPNAYLRRHWLSLFIMLVPVMGYGWIVSAALINALIPRVTFLQSLAIAACVTPTDPILAASVVGKGKFSQKHVPGHLRHLLSAESGINDGMAFPFLFIAIYLLQDPNNPKAAVGEWFYLTWLYQIVLGTFLGTVLGIISRKGIKFAERHNLIDKESFLVLYISLALASIGAVSLLGSDDLLASFFCGTAFAWDGWFSKKTESSNFSDVVDLLLNQTVFIYIGATIPWNLMSDSQGLSLAPWRLVVLAISILLLRRIPAIIAFYPIMRDIKNSREALFAGHFGPIGVGAIFIATLAKNHLSTGDSVQSGPKYVPGQEVSGNLLLAALLQPIIYFLVLSSIIVHGTTIPLFYIGKRLNTITRSITIDTMTRSRTREGNAPAWLSRVRRMERPQGRVDVNSIGPPIFHGRMPSFDRRREEENGKNEGIEGDTLTATGSLDENGDKEKFAGNSDNKGTGSSTLIAQGTSGTATPIVPGTSGTSTPIRPGTSGSGTPVKTDTSGTDTSVRPGTSGGSTPAHPGTPRGPGTPVRDEDVNIDVDETQRPADNDDGEREDGQEDQGRIYEEGNNIIVEGKDGEVIEVLRKTQDEEEQVGDTNPSIRWDDTNIRRYEEEDERPRSSHERPKKHSLLRNSLFLSRSGSSRLSRTLTEPYN